MRTVSMQNTLEHILRHCAQDGRICPAPIKWNEFWEVLKKRQGVDSPPPPLILAAWWTSSDEMKAERLQEQLKWADGNSRLSEAKEFLSRLADEEWHRSHRPW